MIKCLTLLDIPAEVLFGSLHRGKIMFLCLYLTRSAFPKGSVRAFKEAK